MKLTDLFLDQLAKEAAPTKRVLERVPEGRNDWKPHEKSMPLGYLAALVANMPAWIVFIVQQDQLDVASPGGAKFRPPVVATRGELIAMHDNSLASAREVLAGADEEHLLKPWRFLMGGHVAAEQPRYVMIRDTVFSHMAHHRGQLTVYLRLNGAPVPSIYGPSADEGVAG